MTNNFQLSNHMIQTLMNAANQTSDLKVRIRINALLMLNEGTSPELIAETLSIGRSTVYYWHQRWQSLGLEGLMDQKKGPREEEDSLYCDILANALERYMRKSGGRVNIVAVRKLRIYMTLKTGVEIKPDKFRKLLKKSITQISSPANFLSARSNDISIREN